MQCYDLVIIGATFLSLGLAESCNGNCLIIEQKAKPGYEFIDAFRISQSYDAECVTEKGHEFKEYLQKSELLEKAFIPEWTAYVSDYICKNNIRILLFTNVLSVDDCQDGKRITIFNSNGKSTVQARKVVDTRTKTFGKKSLNAVICGDLPEALKNAAVTYKDGNIAVAEFIMPQKCTYPAARQKLFSEWGNRPESFKNATIAAVAEEFCLRSDVEERKIDENYFEFYSAYYDDPLIAFDKGCEIGEKLNAAFDRKN